MYLFLICPSKGECKVPAINHTFEFKGRLMWPLGDAVCTHKTADTVWPSDDFLNTGAMSGIMLQTT